MNKNIIIKSVLALSFLFGTFLIKANCCMDDGCPNWLVVYTNVSEHALETDGGQVVQYVKEGNELKCPTCKDKHKIEEHICDSSMLPVGPRFKEKK